MEPLHRNLAKLRQDHGLSQEALATILGVHQTHIAAIENGRKKPSLPLAIRIAQYFNVTLDELTSETEPCPA